MSHAAIFLSFAFAYFFSTLVRAVTATLAPAFSAELGLSSGDLGLLAGAYFLGFALTQLPLGRALDRHGPRRVLLALMALAVVGCAAFASARQFAALALARAVIGIGLSACLMAPLTAFRRSFGPVRAARIGNALNISRIALGGMDARRFRRLRALGFDGWAAIDALHAR